MNILVTGGAGYIGSVCVAQLLDAGHAVTVVDNLSRGHRAAVDERARLVEGDVGDAEVLARALRGAEAVVHFAAHAFVGESMVHPGLYFENNLARGIRLLQAATEANVRRFVFSSTCSVYGHPERLPLDETTPTRPINPYGASKRMMEEVLQWFHTIHGLPYVAFRYFNAAGATARHGQALHSESRLIPNVLKVARGDLPHVEVFGSDYPTPDGTCIRDYIHVSDIARAHALALETDVTGVFNLGTGRGHSVREVLEVCEKVTGRALARREHSRRPGDPAELVATADKAARELSWRPRISDLEDIVRSAWQWHQAHPHGYDKQSVQ